jgi:hypothetical protein
VTWVSQRLLVRLEIFRKPRIVFSQRITWRTHSYGMSKVSAVFYLLILQNPPCTAYIFSEMGLPTQSSPLTGIDPSMNSAYSHKFTCRIIFLKIDTQNFNCQVFLRIHSKQSQITKLDVTICQTSHSFPLYNPI